MAVDEAKQELPLKDLPGGYGLPFFSAIRDRLDYFYFQGELGFFESRIAKYGSTVFRVNMPPGPFIASNPRVIAVLDAESFAVLFDHSLVDKTDVLTGTFVPSTALTGGFRVCAYLDPSEPNHAKIKQLMFNLLANRKAAFIPAFRAAYASLFSTMDEQLSIAGGKGVEFNKLNEPAAFEFFCEAFFGSSPTAASLGSTGPGRSAKWLFLQLYPLMTLGLPMVLEDLFLHTMRLPAFLIRSDYKVLYNYFNSVGTTVLDDAEKLGLSREEACHNLLFTTVFNAYAGVKLLLPIILKRVVTAGPDLQSRLATEIRDAIKDAGGKVTTAVTETMELVKSVVYEVLRIDPPVKYQYGRAKKDMVIPSHDAAFKVKKGELIFGYQPLATRDEKVFVKGGEFVPDRFVGEEGRRLLKFVYWSNGRETEGSALANKQCAGKDLVVLVARLFVVEFFLRYDGLEAVIEKQALEDKVVVMSVAKATSLD